MHVCTQDAGYLHIGRWLDRSRPRRAVDGGLALV